MVTAEDFEVCGACAGKGDTAALALLKSGQCQAVRMPCADCAGSGRVEAGQAYRRAVGDRLRRARLAVRETMGDKAKRIGIPVVMLSDIEAGRAVRGRIPTRAKRHLGIGAWPERPV